MPIVKSKLLKQLSKNYPNFLKKDLEKFTNIILSEINMKIKEGLISCIMGKNGMGKTTLLETIIGHHNLFSGTIKFKDKNIERLSPYERANLGLAYVPQGREIFPRLTVRENLLTGFLKSKKIDFKDTEVLNLFPVLKKMLHRYGGDLSGGATF